MPTNILVVAAVVDTRQLTLYTTTGEKHYIPQGDPRLAKIVNHITPILSSRPNAVVAVSLATDAVNTYRAFEKQSGGLVRLFRVAKKALAELIGSPSDEPTAPVIVEPQVVGQIPSVTTYNPMLSPFVVASNVVAESAHRAKMMNAVTSILANAQTVPASDPKFNDKDTKDNDEDTIVAIVDNQVIPNIQALKPQMERSVSIGSPKAMNTFMERLAAVSSKRAHSAQDLLKFLTKGDLPIADDGSIVIYKILRKKGEHYVDCHTQKVTQRVGSYVCMEADLVDPNRRNECSNGLHVARRGYLNGFPGDVVVLAKVAPEDVIAVPEYDLNKMRVCGYHILFELSAAAFNTLKANRPFTDNDEAKVLLGRALAGDHPAPIETVKITEHNGGGVVITPTAGTKEAPVAASKPVPEPVPVVVTPAEALPDESVTKAAPAVDPKAVSQQVTEVKAALPETQLQKTQRLYERFRTAQTMADVGTAAKALLMFKKSSKKGWIALGLSDLIGEAVIKASN